MGKLLLADWVLNPNGKDLRRLTPEEVIKKTETGVRGVEYERYLSLDNEVREFLPFRVFLFKHNHGETVRAAAYTGSESYDPLLIGWEDAHFRQEAGRPVLLREYIETKNPFQPDPCLNKQAKGNPFLRKGIATVVDEAIIDIARMLQYGPGDFRHTEVLDSPEAQGFQESFAQRVAERYRVLEQYMKKE